MFDLNTPIEKLTRVGPKFLARLKKLEIKSIKDLLWHFPARYDDFSKLLLISDINNAGEVVSIAGEVTDIEMARSWRRRMIIVNATVEDQSGSIRAVWFNQPYIADALKIGTNVSLSGKISMDKNGLYFSSPSYEKIFPLETGLTHTGRLVPVYPETEGITSKYLRFLIKPILLKMRGVPDPLPSEIIKKYNLPNLVKAINQIHFPKNLEQAESARKRFTLEELLLFQLRTLRDHRQLRMLKAPRINFDKKIISDFVKNLPFKLTDDQRVAAYEILQDLERPFPMNRLLNGDVGSGKTVVALISAFQTVSAGFQTVFMAPTEILAKQHFDSLCSTILTASRSLNADAKIKIGLLTGSEAKQFPTDEVVEEKISKKLLALKIAKGQIDIVIGTHAVIQKGIKFAKLGLVIIDEQHRFGVKQRMQLIKNQELVPHLLSMTATPIPRTLALTVYGDLDVSLIKEKPKGRQQIITKIIPHSKRSDALEFVEQQIRSGRQVFVICPQIETSKTEEPAQNKPISQTKLVWAEIKAVSDEYEKLSKKVFSHRRVAMLHGKMKPKDKNEIMKKFKDGHYDILVSTSVVEVGMDIPNAAVMMIESAERFGLAQLHQFRGRVGRGKHQSYCLLFTSSNDTRTTRNLKALEKTDSGFELAEADLKIRGPGEFTGTQQSGLPDFAMASLADIDLIKKTRLEARLLLKDDPALKRHPLLAARLAEMQRLVHFE
ncbi:MAG: ATP-dependent DNA helicase RecG [Candidatus Yanofskybacteria bacterium]|nr:ATP-dependent DNA helicase RecG [Candidatus Yanofskybacteria bacterium]